MKILLLGKNGQLGWELHRTLASLGPLTALDYADLDFADPQALRAKIRDLAPQIIVNAAAYTNVDKAESESNLAFAVNAAAPGVLAEEAKALGAGLIHYSTDYVFDGRKGQSYLETDAPNPLNVYGSSKLAGERAVQAVDGSYLILRTAWVYSLRGDNFVTKVLAWARRHETLHVVADQVSNPTWSRMLAEVTAQILARGSEIVREHKGLYHLAGGGYASRFEWAQHILELDPRRSQQTVQHVLPALTSEFSTPAQRPLFSALVCDSFMQVFGFTVPAWADALRLAMK